MSQCLIQPTSRQVWPWESRVIFWGLITTWVVWLVGVVLFTAALAGWITEIRHEYKSK
jgi:hypothetical protein